jgi:hypothetical protein
MGMRLCIDQRVLGGIHAFDLEESWRKVTGEVAVQNRLKQFLLLQILGGGLTVQSHHER